MGQGAPALSWTAPFRWGTPPPLRPRVTKCWSGWGRGFYSLPMTSKHFDTMRRIDQRATTRFIMKSNISQSKEIPEESWSFSGLLITPMINDRHQEFLWHQRSSRTSREVCWQFVSGEWLTFTPCSARIYNQLLLMWGTASLSFSHCQNVLFFLPEKNGWSGVSRWLTGH